MRMEDTISEEIRSWLIKDTLEYLNSREEVKEMMETKPRPLETHLKTWSSAKAPYVIDLQVAPQISTALCGFHSLFNSRNLIRTLFEKTTEKKLKNMLKLRNSFAYWHFYHDCKNYLLNIFKIQKKSASDIKWYEEDGSLERPDLKFIVENYPKIKKLKNKYPEKYLDFCYVFYGYDHFMYGSTRQMCAEDKKISEFINSPKDGALVIYLGIINHWACCVMQRENKEYKIYMMDSNNIEHFHKEREQLYENVREYFEELCRIKNKKIDLEKVCIVADRHADKLTLVEMFHDILLHKATFRGMLLSKQCELFFKEYRHTLFSLSRVMGLKEDFGYVISSHLSSLFLFVKSLNEEDGMRMVKIIYDWLLGYKPKVVKDGIFRELVMIGPENLPETQRQLLFYWCEAQLKILEFESYFIQASDWESVSIDNHPKRVLEAYRKVVLEIKKEISIQFYSYD